MGSHVLVAIRVLTFHGMTTDMAQNQTDASDYLYIKPVVVPRKIVPRAELTADDMPVGDKQTVIEFYVVFTFQRRDGNSRAQRSSSEQGLNPLHLPPIVEGVSVEGKKKFWPSLIIDYLKNNVLKLHVLAANSDSVSDPGLPIRVKTPRDLPANWDWLNPKTIDTASLLWKEIFTPALKSLERQNQPDVIAARRQAQKQCPRKADLTSVYMKSPAQGNGADQVQANPVSASDLRPGYRLESIDHRDLAEAFQQAQRQAASPQSSTAAPQNSPNAPRNGADPRQNNLAAPQINRAAPIPAESFSDTYGVHLILQLGFSSTHKLEDFKDFLKTGRGKSGAELADFVDRLWSMYGRATTPSDPAATSFNGSNNDPKFNDLVRNQLKLNPEFAAAVLRIPVEYTEFVLQSGQREIRRQGRFVDASRHRIPGGRVADSGAVVREFRRNAKQGLMRLAAYDHGDDDNNPPYPTIEDILNQINKHPGLMRRLGLALCCRATVDDSAIGPDFGLAVLADPQTDPQLTFDSARDFTPARTRCMVCPAKGQSAPQTFRALPQAPQSFLGVTKDASSSLSPCDNYWQRYLRYNIFSPTLYAVSQDDLSIAAARARAGVHAEDAYDISQQKPTSVNNLVIYSSALDASGNAISVAKALNEHLTKSATAITHSNATADRRVTWCEAQSSPFRLAAMQAGAAAAPQFSFQKGDWLYAEQLMQGVTVFVRDQEKPGEPWRSLCRRGVSVSVKSDLADAGDTPSKPPCCNAHDVPDGFKLLCHFEEEGIVTTSVSAAPQPYVGQVTSDPTGKTKFSLQVIATGNKIDFPCNCSLIIDSDGILKSVLGGVFRPRLERSDLKLYDVVMVTPRGQNSSSDKNAQRDNTSNQSESKIDVICQEVLIHPIFFSEKGFGHITTIGDAPLLSNVECKPPNDRVLPRGNELFPIMVSLVGTRFLNATGNEVQFTDPNFGKKFGPGLQFTVDGERRYWTQPWWSGTNAPGASARLQSFAPVGSLSIDPTASAANYDNLPGILTNLGAANLLTPYHLLPTDSCKAIPFVWAPPTALGTHVVQTVGWLDVATGTTIPANLLPRKSTDSSATAAASSSNSAAASGSAANGTAADGAAPDSAAATNNLPLSATPTLQLQRGTVQKISCQIIINSSNLDNLWTLSIGPTKLTFDQGSIPTPAVASTDGSENAIVIQGQVSVVNGYIKLSNATTVRIVAPLVCGGAPVSIAWTLTLQRPDQSQIDVQYAEVIAADPAPWNVGPRFMHPLFTPGKLIEAILASDGQTLVARAWPQHPCGTISASTTSAAMYFDDGSKSALDPTSALPFDGQTVRLQIATIANKLSVPSAISNLSEEAGLLIGGEITAVTTVKESDGSQETELLLTDLHGRSWTVHDSSPDSAPAMLPAPYDNIAARRLKDLEVGEFLIARCNVWLPPDPKTPAARHVTIVSSKTPPNVQASACLLGMLGKPELVSPGTLTREGTSRYELATLSPIVKTNPDAQAGASSINDLDIWFLQEPSIPAPDTLVVLPALRVIYATTITEFEIPTDQATPDAIPPVHAVASEMITRWAGWSLATTQPGRADADPALAGTPSGFRIDSYRPDLRAGSQCVPDAARPSWLLPPLRFDKRYEFYLRRADLAGNHDYDEPIDPVDLNQLGGSQIVKSLYVDTITNRARKAASVLCGNGSDRSSDMPQDKADAPLSERFQPATIPSPPMLAFQNEHQTAAEKSPTSPTATQLGTVPGIAPTTTSRRPPHLLLAATESTALKNGHGGRMESCTKSGDQPGAPGNPPETPDGQPKTTPDPMRTPADPRYSYDCLKLIFSQKEQRLLLVSDVLDRPEPCGADKPRRYDRYARARLLPPPASVETVLLAGKLDRSPADGVVDWIRYNERFWEGEDGQLGVDTFGRLNYFGDSWNSDFGVRLQSDSCNPSTPLQVSRRLAFYRNKMDWFPLDISVRLEAAPRGDEPVADGPDLSPQDIQSVCAADAKACEITAKLPPGTTGQLFVCHRSCESGEQTQWDSPSQPKNLWRTFQLIHATNGAWSRPIVRWLREIVGRADPTNAATRHFSGELELDVPSTASYSVQAYWNDPQDESVAALCGPAEAMARVNCGTVERVDLIDPGFGFGSAAVPIFPPPTRPPEIRPILSDGRVVDYEIVEAGAGCTFDFIFDTVPDEPSRPADPASDKTINKPIRARAIARINRSGQVQSVNPITAGSDLPPECKTLLVSLYQPPKFQVNCANGVVTSVVPQPSNDDQVCEGRFWRDFRFRMIRRPPLVNIAEAEICRAKEGPLREEEIAIRQHGGWYAVPPIVVAYDIDGDGYGANLVAELNDAGGVGHVKVVCGGSHYSRNVRLVFYTNQHHVADQPIPQAGPNQRLDRCRIEFDLPVGGIDGRAIDFVVQLTGRFKSLLDGESAAIKSVDAAATGLSILNHVPRFSTPFEIELSSNVRPAKPDVSYLMPSFEWEAHAGSKIDLDDAREYFRCRPRGRLKISRSPAIRVYLNRPWHKSGREQLGVVVVPHAIEFRHSRAASASTGWRPTQRYRVHRPNDAIGESEVQPPVDRAALPAGYRATS
jgi:hypothetical protein